MGDVCIQCFHFIIRRQMLELMFAIYDRAAEVCPHKRQGSLLDVRLALGIGSVDQVLHLHKI